MPDGSHFTRMLDRDAPAARRQSPRGRGIGDNPAARFDHLHAELCSDGWDSEPDAPAPRPTTLHRDGTRSALSWNSSPDLVFDRAINPYRGCEHGCSYCYARPSHAYLGYSPGLDFETEIVFKPEVAAILERELSRPGYRPRTVALGSNTDPYQPVERTLRLTRSVLEVLDRFNHPVSIVTKSAAVVRDADILGRMARRGLARVLLSITTLDPVLARRMEPRASGPALRLRAVADLSAAGIPVGVLAAPMIPGLNDAELETIVERAVAAGASTADYTLLRLSHELGELFTAWLQEHVPDRARRVLSLIRETRAGALNDPAFGTRFRGTGPYADLLAQRFARVRRRLHLQERELLDCSQFRVPERAEDRRQGQLALV